MAAGPDQGFAWVIALACFFINFIMAGLARTAGVLFVAIINLYGVSREAATTPFSIRVCVRNMTGPLIGLLGLKYGIRAVTTVGGAVAGLGSILCYFAPNVFWITIFWGVIHGLGFGLSTVLHMIAVNQYFDKYKASALGLGYSGDCFGTFAFPVIMEHLIATYDIRGTFLIIGGLVLNVIPMALLLRKPPWIKDGSNKRKPKKSSKKKREASTIKNHTNSLLLERNKVLKCHPHLGCLTTVNETDSIERVQINESGNFENVKNSNNFINPGFGDSRGQYNKAFESSETNLSSLENKDSQNLKKLNSDKFVDNLEKSKPTPASFQSNCLTPSSSKMFQCFDTRPSNSKMNNSKHFLKTEDLHVCSEMRTSRSVSDLNRRNESHCCNTNRSPISSKLRNINSQERRESLPHAFGRETSMGEKIAKSKSHEDVKREVTNENEVPPAEDNSISKKRTSSFVGQVAQEIVNRMRTASFASQVAQDAFVTTIGEETDSDSDSEPELGCELKSIVEHKGHDIENCTHQDLILSIDKNMIDDYFKEIPQKEENAKEEKHHKQPSVLKVLLKINTKPMFILISASMAVYAFLFVSVLTVIIDYASDLGVSEDQGKYLIIGFSVADLIGRLSFGQVIDRKLMKMKNYSGTTMLLMGTLVAVIPLNTSFNYMMVCMCMYGVVQGGTAIMFPILINMYMDRNSESVAMGSLNFYGGLLMLLMAPMIGFFRDNTGSYNSVFYIIGGVVIVVGIIWQFEPMIIKFQNRKLREKYIMKEMGKGNM